MTKINSIFDNKVEKLGMFVVNIGRQDTTGNTKRLNGSFIFKVTDYRSGEEYTGTKGRCLNWINSQIEKSEAIE